MNRFSPRLLNKIAVILFMAAIVTTMPASEKSGADKDYFNWCATTISGTVGGQPITDQDLAGRVVLLIQNNLGEDDAWNSFAVKTTMEFIGAVPPGALVPVFIVDDAKANIAAWKAKGGINTVGFVERKKLHIPGFIWGGGPRFVLIDADGMVVSDMIIDGRDLSGGSRYQSRGILMKPNDVQRVAEQGPGPMVLPGNWQSCTSEVNELIDASVTSASIAPTLKSLRELANKKQSKPEALQIIAAVRQYIQRQQSVAERNYASNPLLFKRILERLLKQLGNDEWAEPIEELMEKAKANKSYQAEIKAAEDFHKVLRTAAEISFGVGDPDASRPASHIKAIRSGLATIQSRHPKSQAAQWAKDYQAKWDVWVSKAINPIPW